MTWSKNDVSKRKYKMSIISVQNHENKRQKKQAKGEHIGDAKL